MCMKEFEDFPLEYCEFCPNFNNDPEVGIKMCMREDEEIEEINLFKQKMAIIKFIIANMDKIIKDGILLTEVIEEPHKHPHYHSCVSTELYYDNEKECLVHNEARSGSPSAVNHYPSEVFSIMRLAENIRDDINAANSILSSEEEDVCGSVIKIEGM